MELIWSGVLLLCVTWLSAADDFMNDSQINLEKPLSEDVKQYISKVMSTMAAKHADDIKVLQNRIDEQENKINTLESEKQLHTSAISEIEKKILNVGNKMNTCNCECGKQSDERNFTDKKSQTLSKGSSDSQEDQGINQTSKQVISKHFQRSIRDAHLGVYVAFFATMSTSVTHVGEDQDIVFDHAVTNIGQAYNANLGKFIAPVAGTYVFTVTLCHDVVYSIDGTWGHVVVNGAVVAKLRVFHEQSSQTIVVNLQTGDGVSIQNTVTDRGFDGDRYSAFSGFLLFEDFSGGATFG